MMNYTKDIRISEDNLDVEWLEQAALAVKWGLYFNELDDEVTRATENVKVVYSELTLKINTFPEQYLGDSIKPTDEKVKAAAYAHADHLAAKERWMKALKEKADAEIVYKEISYTRKSALENLVTLHGQNYFAGPRMPRDLKTERDNFGKARAAMSEKINKRKRKK